MKGEKQKPRRSRRLPAVRRAALYERLKAQWSCEHPSATSAEYEAAMRMLAKRAGV